MTLTQDFLPSARLPYGVDIWGIATFAGSVGLFLTLLLLFLRYLPAISIVESRRLALTEAPAVQDAARHSSSHAGSSTAWLESWRAADAEVGRRLDALLRAQPGLTPYDAVATVSRSLPLPAPSHDVGVLADAAVSLLDRVEHDRPVRLLGVRLEMVEPEGGYER